MHEWLITRGHAQGADFETRMQIFVPWNVVLLHEGECHRTAQWKDWGKMACYFQVHIYYSDQTITKWLEYLEPRLSIASEKRRWIQETNPMDVHRVRESDIDTVPASGNDH